MDESVQALTSEDVEWLRAMGWTGPPASFTDANQDLSLGSYEGGGDHPGLAGVRGWVAGWVTAFREGEAGWPWWASLLGLALFAAVLLALPG